MDFTKNNPSLAPLFTLKYPTDYFPLPNKKLPRTMRKEGEILYQSFFGKEQDPEDFTFLLKTSEGELQRLYGPSVGKDPDSDALALKWGQYYTVLKLEGSNIVAPLLPEGWNFETLTISETNFGYLEPELSVNAVLETPDEFYEVAFPIRFEDPKKPPKLAAFKTALKKDPKKALSLVAASFEGEGGGFSIQKLTDFPEDTTVKITNFEDYEFTTKKGETFQRVVLHDDQGKKYWSPDSVIDHAIHLFDLDKCYLTLNSFAVNNKGNKYINHAVLTDRKLTLLLGSEIKASLPDTDLSKGEYKVLGVDSFMVNSNGKNFKSYLYTLQSMETEIIFKSFAPPKHRTILNSEPLINKENPGYFTVLTSGEKDKEDFTVTQLVAKFEENEDSIDLEGLF